MSVEERPPDSVLLVAGPDGKVEITIGGVEVIGETEERDTEGVGGVPPGTDDGTLVVMEVGTDDTLNGAEGRGGLLAGAGGVVLEVAVADDVVGVGTDEPRGLVLVPPLELLELALDGPDEPGFLAGQFLEV